MAGLVAGVDEAGRGPLAGPVVAAAVILDPAQPIAGLADSKKLSPVRRATLAIEIRRYAIAWAVAWADAEEIDRLNILVASHLAMRRALTGLPAVPDHVEIDGNRLPNLQFPGYRLTGTAIIGGDSKVAEISAASILAKVARDHTMVRLDALYPQYGFAQHKGYPTQAHRDRLSEYGPSPQHRRSFRPLSMPA